MTVTRNGDWGLQDYTPLTSLIERTDNALEALGLFEEIYGTTTVAEVERMTFDHDEIEAKARGGERNYIEKETAQKEYFQIPFYPLDSLAKPSDVQDFREYGTADTPASVETRVERNLQRIGDSHMKLKRRAMYTALKGNTFAGGLTGSQFDKNFATVWGVTGDVVSGVGIDFTDAAADPSLFIEKTCREHIQDQAQDDAEAYEIVVLAGSGWFNSFVNHPLTQAAYSQYASQQEPLRQRLAPSNGRAVGRVFEHKGTVYIEDVSKQIDRDKAYVLPVGIPMFQIHYAPADTLEHANTVAEEMYIFMEQDSRKVKIQSETSFQVVNNRPELVCILDTNVLLPDA